MPRARTRRCARTGPTGPTSPRGVPSASVSAMPAVAQTVSLCIASRAEAGPLDARRSADGAAEGGDARPSSGRDQSGPQAGRAREPGARAPRAPPLGLDRRHARARDRAREGGAGAGGRRGRDGRGGRRRRPARREPASSAGRRGAPGAAGQGPPARRLRRGTPAQRTRGGPREHLTYTPEGLRLLIPKSKSDQEGAGQVVGVAYGDRPRRAPSARSGPTVGAASRALADQGRASPLSGPVFRGVDRWGGWGTAR